MSLVPRETLAAYLDDALGDLETAQVEQALRQNETLRKQLHGLTLYAPSDASEDGVLLVYADFDAERLVTLAKGANDYQSATHKTHLSVGARVRDVAPP